MNTEEYKSKEVAVPAIILDARRQRRAQEDAAPQLADSSASDDTATLRSKALACGLAGWLAGLLACLHACLILYRC